MSVYLSDRGENKFEVLVKARELAVYTIQITHNKNVFSDYDSVVNDLQKLGKDIFIELWYANNCDLISESELRLQYQKKAIRDCYALLATIQLAQPLYHLKLKRVEYWSRMIINVRDLTRKWRESDKKRLASLKKK